MNLNVIKLRNLVNKDQSFYEHLDESNSEEDIMNKYDSDEENTNKESESEEESETQGNDDNNKPKTEEIEKEEVLTLNTYTRTIDKDSIPGFKWKEATFYDDDLIHLVNSISSDSNSLTSFLTSLSDKISFDNEEMLLFYSSIFAFCLKKLFCFIKINALITEIIQSFGFINNIAVSFIQEGLSLYAKSDTLNNKLSLNIIHLCDYVLELYLSITIAQLIDQPKSFFALSLKYIQLFLLNKAEDTQAYIFIRKYIETFSQLITDISKYNLTFSIEELKYLFSISFTLLRREEYSNIFITIIDIICYIVEIVNEASFEEKFIENMLSCFDEFLAHNNYSDDKFKYYLWNKQVLRNYKFYFGEYNSLNSESISLFTYLFLKFYSVMFAKEDFIKAFEMFLVKLFEWTKPNVLLCLCCLMNDLLKIKYNAEFTIALILITNIYLSVSSLLSKSNLELNKRKLLINLCDHFFDDLLNEFSIMKDGYLCLGKLNQENEKNKKKRNRQIDKESKYKPKKSKRGDKCECFSCEYTLKKSKSNHFDCKQCHCKTNLKLQLIDPQKDNDQSICGFCNLKFYFENSAMLFEKESELKLLDTNEDLIEEYSKSKIQKELILSQQLKERDEKEPEMNITSNKPKNLFDKFIYYQEALYQNAFLFLKINLINYIRLTNSTDNKKISSNIDNSFKIFLKILINDQKMNSPKYINFTEAIIQYYTVQKERLFNMHQDIQIDDLIINYFYFFHFYVNFLFAGHWKIIDLILNDKANWMIRYKSLKILEKFILFEGNSIIFQNFEVGLIAPLLCDNSFNIREYSLDILFKLYKNGRIERGHLIYILYENINESSFLIRKRIIKALSGLVIEENERGENLKTIIVIFLNKLNDNSESSKIKKLIYDFFIVAFKSSSSSSSSSSSTADELKFSLLDIIISLLNENEDLSTGTNCLYENIRNLFDNIVLNRNALTKSIDYLIENYFFNKKREGEEILQALNVMRIISYYEKEGVIIYIEYIHDMMKYTYQREDKTDRGLINRIIQTSCEIISNLFDETNRESIRIKNALINAIENTLITLILTKPCFVMTSAIEVYFKMTQRGLINADKISLLTIQNYNFLLKYYDNKTSDISSIPEMILTKSLSLLSYIVYSIKDDAALTTIFDNKSINEITNDIFNILLYYTMTNKKTINFRAFESLGFFWIRYPLYLNQSTEVVNYVINQLSSEDDKVIILKTFIHFFSKIRAIISSLNNSSSNNDSESESDRNRNSPHRNTSFDFGVLHLFFEQFISKFSIFLINETSVVIRTHTIHLIKLIIELGNVNVHNVLPHIFASLFDINGEIRYVSACLLEKTINISKEKFFSLIKECLKCAYTFHKTFYVNSKYFTSFVKERQVNKEGSFVFTHTTENIFELFNYKTSKYDKHNLLQKRLLDKFLFAFSEITALEKEFTPSSTLSQLRNAIESFEYYEFVAKLVGDFKYSTADDVLFVFDKLFSSYETNYCIYKSKVKQYKEKDSCMPMDFKDMFYFLQCGVESALIKFLLVKYEVLSDDKLEIVKRKGWNDYRKEAIENDLNNSDIREAKEKSNKKKKDKESKVIMTKEFVGIKYHVFYLAFNEYFKRVLCVQMKKKFTRKDQNMLIELLNKLKYFNNMKLSQILRLVKGSKKKLKNEPCEAFYDMFFKIEASNKIDCTNVKVKKGIQLDNINENRRDNEDVIKNKNNNYYSDDDRDEKGKKRIKIKKKKMNKRIEIQ